MKAGFVIKILSCLIFLMIWPVSSRSQNQEIRKCMEKVKAERSFYKKAELLNDLANLYRDIVIDSSLYFRREADRLLNTERITDEPFVKATLILRGDVLRCMGYDHYLTGDFKEAEKQCKASVELLKVLMDYPDSRVSTGAKKIVSANYVILAILMEEATRMEEAIAMYFKAIEIKKALGHKEGLAVAYSNLAIAYHEIGANTESLHYNYLSLQLREELKDKEGVASDYINIGNIFDSQQEKKKAMEYYSKALDISRKHGFKSTEGMALISLGNIFRNQGAIAKAIDHFRDAAAIFERQGNIMSLAACYGNLGNSFKDMKDFKSALTHYDKGLELQKGTGNGYYTSNAYSDIGEVLFMQKKYAASEQILKKAVYIAEEIKGIEELRNAHLHLYTLYKKTGRQEKALLHYEKFILMRDSIENEGQKKASMKAELKYEYEKKAAADSVAHVKEREIKNAELAKQQAEIRAKKGQQYALFGGLGLVMVFAGFMYNRFKVTQKQKSIIELQKTEVEEQKKLVEEKQREVLDSIQYAKRIQMAQIPSEKRVHSLLQKTKRDP